MPKVQVNQGSESSNKSLLPSVTKVLKIFWLSNNPAVAIARRSIIVSQPFRLVISNPHFPHDLQLYSYQFSYYCI